jgi:hypothetical protein
LPETSYPSAAYDVDDLVTAWDDADGGQRTALLARIFDTSRRHRSIEEWYRP